jgi:hypothetical protein
VTRFVTALAVLTVAVIGAVVSYSHVYDLGIAHGQSGTAARLLPLSVDGLILAASLVLLQAARSGHQAPALPRFALWLGIGATVAANLAYGLPYGPIGAVLSAWPGAAFVLSVEILLGSLRRSQTETAHEGSQAHQPAVPGTAKINKPLPANRPTSRGMSASPEVVFAQELDAGKVPGIRTVKRKMRCGQPRAETIQADLAAYIQARMSAPGDAIEVTA